MNGLSERALEKHFIGLYKLFRFHCYMMFHFQFYTLIRAKRDTELRRVSGKSM
jgi:hypothetical protein